MPPMLEHLSPEAVESFNRLKRALTEPPILALPRSGLPYSLDTDACDDQVRVALMQLYPDGTRHPISYCSRCLNNAKKNYSVTENTCLAVV